MVSIAPLFSCMVYTPRNLADAMVAAIAGAGRKKWLEPSCGQGVFLQSLRALGTSRTDVHAIDIDLGVSEADSCATALRGVDFLSWAPSHTNQFDCIVGNPPYVAIRELPEPLQSAAAQVRDHQGHQIGRRANTWYAFLQASVQLLKMGGNLAFVLPAACEYADYCKAGRECITQFFERVDLIRSQHPLFSVVQEGAAVLVCQNKRIGQGVFRRHEVADLEETIERLHRLTNHRARSCPAESRRNPRSSVRFGDVIAVKLGGVTGDSRFFTISEERRHTLCLPAASLQPVLSKCRHVRRPWIYQADWRKLKELGQRVWLFNPSAPVTENPAVKKYLSLNEDAGGCRRTAFKVRNREPWFQTPLPPSPDGFISGMCEDGIWICLNGMPQLNATNTLYVVYFREHLSLNHRFAAALALLTTVFSKRLHRIRRRYADGLLKIEPGQLADLDLPSFMHVTTAKEAYGKALSILFKGNLGESRRIADAAILGGECKG